MARSAMRWAARSPKPSAAWQLRTSSAKAPPPGTTTTGSGDDAIASSQAASSPERTTLTPNLTTTVKGLPVFVPIVPQIVQLPTPLSQPQAILVVAHLYTGLCSPLLVSW